VRVPQRQLAWARQVQAEEAEEPAAHAATSAVEPAPRSRPGLYWVVGLALVNVLVWWAMEAQGGHGGGSERYDVLLRFGASHAPSVLHGAVWRTVTAIFLHIGLKHLLGNTISLLVFGPAVLRAWGAARFFFAYLVCGAAGNWLSLAVSPTMAVKAGASGAILGLLGVLAGARIRRLRTPGSHGRERLKTWHVLAMLAAFYGFTIGIGPVDHLAHIGGLAAGLGLAFILPPPGRLPRRRDLVLETVLGGSAALVTIVAALLAWRGH
jgi:membrane associated rhomboid family serine protease